MRTLRESIMDDEEELESRLSLAERIVSLCKLADKHGLTKYNPKSGSFGSTEGADELNQAENKKFLLKLAKSMGFTNLAKYRYKQLSTVIRYLSDYYEIDISIGSTCEYYVYRIEYYPNKHELTIWPTLMIGPSTPDILKFDITKRDNFFRANGFQKKQASSIVRNNVHPIYYLTTI